jgi:hypothetical protein
MRSHVYSVTRYLVVAGRASKFESQLPEGLSGTFMQRYLPTRLRYAFLRLVKDGACLSHGFAEAPAPFVLPLRYFALPSCFVPAHATILRYQQGPSCDLGATALNNS